MTQVLTLAYMTVAEPEDPVPWWLYDFGAATALHTLSLNHIIAPMPDGRPVRLPASLTALSLVGVHDDLLIC